MPLTNLHQSKRHWAQAADDPAGNKAWLAHGFTEPQRESLREAFQWGIENRFIPGGALLVIHRGDPVDKYLPQFAGVTIRGTGVAARSPKICELLAHTAGFPSNNDRGVVAGRQLIAAETLQAQYRPQPPTGRNGCGLGFNIMRTDANGMGSRIRHTGASGTLALIDFQQDLIVVMLTQVPTNQTQPFGDRLVKGVNSVFSDR